MMLINMFANIGALTLCHFQGKLERSAPNHTSLENNKRLTCLKNSLLKILS